MGGEPRLDGRRVSVRQIAELVIDNGTLAAEVADQIELPRADVHRALTYYYAKCEPGRDGRRSRPTPGGHGRTRGGVGRTPRNALSMSLSFLADEHVKRVFVAELRANGYDVT